MVCYGEGDPNPRSAVELWRILCDDEQLARAECVSRNCSELLFRLAQSLPWKPLTQLRVASSVFRACVVCSSEKKVFAADGNSTAFIQRRLGKASRLKSSSSTREDRELVRSGLG